MLAQLLRLFLRHPFNPPILLTFPLPLILPTEPCPEEQIYDSRHSDEAHGDGMALNEAGSFVCFVELNRIVSIDNS